MLQHFLGMEVGDEEGDVIALIVSMLALVYPQYLVPTFTGFLRKIKKASARCVRNLVNLWTCLLYTSPSPRD